MQVGKQYGAAMLRLGGISGAADPLLRPSMWQHRRIPGALTTVVNPTYLSGGIIRPAAADTNPLYPSSFPQGQTPMIPPSTTISTGLRAVALMQMRVTVDPSAFVAPYAGGVTVALHYSRNNGAPYPNGAIGVYLPEAVDVPFAVALRRDYWTASGAAFEEQAVSGVIRMPAGFWGGWDHIGDIGVPTTIAGVWGALSDATGLAGYAITHAETA